MSWEGRGAVGRLGAGQFRNIVGHVEGAVGVPQGGGGSPTAAGACLEVGGVLGEG